MLGARRSGKTPKRGVGNDVVKPTRFLLFYQNVFFTWRVATRIEKLFLSWKPLQKKTGIFYFSAIRVSFWQFLFLKRKQDINHNIYVLCTDEYIFFYHPHFSLQTCFLFSRLLIRITENLLLIDKIVLILWNSKLLVFIKKILYDHYPSKETQFHKHCNNFNFAHLYAFSKIKVFISACQNIRCEVTSAHLMFFFLHSKK